MAGMGPPPKDPSQRRRRNADTIERKRLDDQPRSHPPLPGADNYLPQTISWYETWANSPQASRFLATDWQRLHMLAPLVDAYWMQPDKQIMSEIRLNEASLGATEADRLRLRWDIAPPEKPSIAKTPSKDPAQEDRRAQAMRLVIGGLES